MKLERLAEDAAVEMCAIDRLAVPWPWSLKQYQQSFVSGDLIWGCVDHAEMKNVLQGFAVFQRVLDECTLMNLVTHPAYQRQGIAFALLQKTLFIMKTEYGVQRCFLEVRESNQAAIHLYEKCDFVKDGYRKNYYPIAGGREAAILMSCAL